jgi:hypothetical protein
MGTYLRARECPDAGVLYLGVWDPWFAMTPPIKWNQLSEPLLEARQKSPITVLRHLRRARHYGVIVIAALALVTYR